MDRSMVSSAVSMNAIQKALDTVANNLSNVDTTGFKERQVQFEALMEQNKTDQPDATVSLGRGTPLGLRLGTGAKVASTKLDNSVGTIKQTDRPLDVALLKDDQFFTIQTHDSNGNATTSYTRDGAFYLQPDATNASAMNLVTENGAFVLDTNGNPIQTPTGTQSVTFDQTGALQAVKADGTIAQVDQLGIVSIARPQLLESSGGNTYTLPNLATLNIPVANVLTQVTPQNVALKTGALETSNVDLTTAMTQLTQLQKAYQFNARSIQVSDDMMNLINNIR